MLVNKSDDFRVPLIEAFSSAQGRNNGCKLEMQIRVQLFHNQTEECATLATLNL